MMVYQVDSQAMSGEGAAGGALRRDTHLPLHRRRHLLLEDLLDLGGVRVRLGVHVGDDGVGHGVCVSTAAVHVVL